MGAKTVPRRKKISNNLFFLYCLLIIFGTPVWASTFVPPLRTFIHDNPDVKNKKIAVFTCFSGGGADKAIDKMKKYIGINHFEAELILIDPKDNIKAEDDEKIAEFCSRLN